MAVKLSLEQKQVQTLVLSPQMQQAIYLLQLPLLELRQFLQQQLVQNPVLEEVEGTEPPPSEEEPPAKLKEDDYEPDVKEEMERLAKFDGEWQGYLRGMGVSGRSGPEDEEKRRFFENSLARQPSLQEYLLRQLYLSISSSQEEEIGETIIGNIDENGYLQASVEELTKSLKSTKQKVETILSLIQTFDPSGVGARDLKECLLIQLRNSGREDTLEARIIAEHLKDLERKRYPHIVKCLRVSLDKVTKSARDISCLEPKPGRKFSPEKSYPITPDLILKKINGEYNIIANDGDLPRLRVSPLYQKLAKEGNSELGAQQYLLEKFKSAVWVIENIERRRKTIRRVAECIVKKQREFLDKGIEYLQPCTLGEIAAEIGMHESTVSRVTANKYMDTPRGIFELKSFFAGKIPTQDNGSLSSRSVKAKIKELIKAEDKQHPLSDGRIVKHLLAQGIHITRRTVAKYRESLKILPSTLRKKY
ncbi:RNA polymerase factor sigma-54 [candidate division NPL-UPA2 bacterium]|nr:RNA polymerase factor sigma-54 [candidate division NPL-UPA2 bacterium]